MARPEDEHEGGHDEGVGQGEGERAVERQAHQTIPELPHSGGGAPGFADLSEGEVGAVGIGAEPVESAQRRGFAQGFRGLLVDGRFVGTPKRTAVLDGDQDLFMLNVKRLDEDRDDGQRDEKGHRRKRRQDEPEEGFVFHVLPPSGSMGPSGRLRRPDNITDYCRKPASVAAVT
jgi:hypothetical protein